MARLPCAAPTRTVPPPTLRTGGTTPVSTDAPDIMSNRPTPLVDQAVNLYRAGHTETAITLLQDLVSRCTDDADARYCLAKALYNARRLPEAILEYREVLRVAPDDECAHYHLALLLRDQGQLDEAERELRTAIALCPGSFGIGWLRRHMLTRGFLEDLLRRLVLRSGIERTLPSLVLF